MATSLELLAAQVQALADEVTLLKDKIDGSASGAQMRNSAQIIEKRLQDIEADIVALQSSVETLQNLVAEE